MNVKVGKRLANELEWLRLATLSIWPEIAPGLHGHIAEVFPGHERILLVKTVAATTPGSGAFSRWLDSLPTDTTYVFWNVVNPTIIAALERRGWKRTFFAGSDASYYR